MAFTLILDASNIDAWTKIQRVLYGDPGPPLVLTGPAGVGKTRLLDAAIGDIERRRPPVTVLGCSVQKIADRHTRQRNLARRRRPEIGLPNSETLPPWMLPQADAVMLTGAHRLGQLEATRDSVIIPWLRMWIDQQTAVIIEEQVPRDGKSILTRYLDPLTVVSVGPPSSGTLDKLLRTWDLPRDVLTHLLEMRPDTYGQVLAILDVLHQIRTAERGGVERRALREILTTVTEAS
jgi:hypothetical protein